MARRRLQRGIAPRDRDRRSAILRALFRCLRDRGYIATSLADVAAEAGMSPSHVLYYFSSKDAVLESLFELSAGNMLRDVEALRRDDVADHCDALADYFFGGRVLGRTDQAIMLQFFGLATHDRRLWQIKAGFDRRVKSHLEALLRRGGLGSAAADASEAAYAELVGLLTSLYFDERLARSRAKALFRGTLARLAASCGAPASVRARPTRRSGGVPAAPPAGRRKWRPSSRL